MLENELNMAGTKRLCDRHKIIIGCEKVFWRKNCCLTISLCDGAYVSSVMNALQRFRKLTADYPVGLNL